MIYYGNNKLKNIIFENKTQDVLNLGNVDLITKEGVDTAAEMQNLIIVPSAFTQEILTGSSWNFVYQRDKVVFPQATDILNVRLPSNTNDGQYVIKTKFVGTAFAISMSTLGGIGYSGNYVDVRLREYDSGLVKARMRVKTSARGVDFYNGESTFVGSHSAGSNDNCYYISIRHGTNIVECINGSAGDSGETLFTTTIEKSKPMYIELTFNYATKGVYAMSAYLHRHAAITNYQQVNF